MNKRLFFIVFASIFFIGSIVRLLQLSDMPPSLNWDEISHGYNAFSILKTGSDEWGQTFPLTNFRAYGDYPLPLNLYLTIPFISVLGVTATAIRLPHALLGIGTMLSVFFLVYGLTKKRGVSLLSMFLVAIGPWYFFTSRFVLQSNLSVFLLTLAMAFFFNRKQHKYFTAVTISLLGLTLFAYHTTRIFTPLFLLGMLFFFRKELLNKLNIFVMLLFFLPLPFILLNPNARARSTEVFLLNDAAIYSIETARNTSSLPPIVQKILYNKPVYLVKQSISHYVDYFGPQFLFFKGGTQYQFSIPDHGVLYAVSAPFFYIGLLYLLSMSFRKKHPHYKILLFWLLIAPLPASITTERFAVLRSTTMLPLPELLVSLGVFEVISFIKRKSPQISKAVLPLFILLTSLSFYMYLCSYLGDYKRDYSWTWQFGYKEVVNFMQSHYSQYDHFIVTKKYGEPHEFVLFYNSWDPGAYKTDPHLVRYTQSHWWWVDSFDKYVFVNDWQIPKEGSQFITERKSVTDCINKRCLLVSSSGNAPKGWSKIQSINFLDGKNAFELYENK